MKNLLRLREEDYWLIPISGVGALCLAAVLFAGASYVQVPAAAIAVSILLFVHFIIKKHYSSQASRKFLIIFILSGCLLAYAGYILTN